MKVYRYMSCLELKKLMKGEKLENHRTFNKTVTSSKGFCFLGEETKFTGEYYGKNYEKIFSPGECFLFLEGIVADDVLVEFECDDKLLNKSSGSYADPCGDGMIATREYCTEQYDKKGFKPLRYATQSLMDEEGRRFYTHTEWRDISEVDKDVNLKSVIFRKGILRESIASMANNNKIEKLQEVGEMIIEEVKSKQEFQKYMNAIMLCKRRGEINFTPFCSDLEKFGFSIGSRESSELEMAFFSYILNPENNLYDKESEIGIAKMFQDLNLFEKNKRFRGNIINPSLNEQFSSISVLGSNVDIYEIENGKYKQRDAKDILQDIESIYAQLTFTETTKDELTEQHQKERELLKAIAEKSRSYHPFDQIEFFLDEAEEKGYKYDEDLGVLVHDITVKAEDDDWKWEGINRNIDDEIETALNIYYKARINGIKIAKEYNELIDERSCKENNSSNSQNDLASSTLSMKILTSKAFNDSNLRTKDVDKVDAEVSAKEKAKDPSRSD